MTAGQVPLNPNRLPVYLDAARLSALVKRCRLCWLAIPTSAHLKAAEAYLVK